MDLHTKIRLTAQQLFFENGYNDTTLEDIAQAIGEPNDAIYPYFDSKQAVLEAVAAAKAQQYHALVLPVIVDPTLNATEKFNRAFGTSVDSGVEDMDQLWAVSRALYQPENAPLLAQLNVTLAQMYVPEYVTILTQGVAEGRFVIDDIENSAEFIWAIMRSIELSFITMLLDNDRPENAFDLIAKKYETGQRLVEHIAGAEPNSFKLVDPTILSVWLA